MIKMGYTPYVIKDYDHKNKNIVQDEFNKFLKYCGVL